MGRAGAGPAARGGAVLTPPMVEAWRAMGRRPETFYLAASSRNREGAALAIAELEALGLRCVMDWTGCLDAPEEEWPALAQRDVHAARSADVFVHLEPPPSYGAWLELGVRLGAGRRAHVVSAVTDHVFMRHPLVEHHGGWPAFVSVVREWMA